MKLVEAQKIIRQVDGKSYSYLKEWGISTVKEALRTILDRVSSTQADVEIAQAIRYKIIEGYYKERDDG